MLPPAINCHICYHLHPFHFVSFKIWLLSQHPTTQDAVCILLKLYFWEFTLKENIKYVYNHDLLKESMAIESAYTCLPTKYNPMSCKNSKCGSVLALTIGWVVKLSTHHCSINTSPGNSTHSAPHIVHADLHSAFIWNVTSCQSQLTSCTWSCM